MLCHWQFGVCYSSQHYPNWSNLLSQFSIIQFFFLIGLLIGLFISSEKFDSLIYSWLLGTIKIAKNLSLWLTEIVTYTFLHLSVAAWLIIPNYCFLMEVIIREQSYSAGHKYKFKFDYEQPWANSFTMSQFLSL